jgi:hypothetical protein
MVDVLSHLPAHLFDHPVGAREQHGRNVEAKRGCGLEVDRRLVVERQLDR